LVRKQVEELASAWEHFLDKLPDRFGGKVDTCKVQCPECQGAGRVHQSPLIGGWKPCPSCRGQKEIIWPAPLKGRDELSHPLCKRLSKLQRAILIASRIKAHPMPTNRIRRVLRGRKIRTTNVGFSRALARLEKRGLLQRFGFAKTTSVQLT